VTLVDEGFHLDQMSVPAFGVQRETALLNHPSVHFFRDRLPEAFNLKLAGSDTRISAGLSATYSQSRRDFTRPIDDYISLMLGAQIPTAYRKAKRIHDAYWDHMIQSWQIASQSQKRRVVENVNEARMDFLAAQRDWKAKQAGRSYHLERLRLARLYLQKGLPQQEKVPDPLSVNEVRFNCLMAEQKLIKVRTDLGIRFAHLWREQGLSWQLSDAIDRRRGPESGLRTGSMRLRDPDELPGGDTAIDRF